MKFEKWEEAVASKTCQRAFERAVTVTGAAVTYCFSVSALLSAAFSVCSATSSLDTRQALGVTTGFEQNCTLSCPFSRRLDATTRSPVLPMLGIL